MQSCLAQILADSHRDLRRWFLYHQECLLLRQDHFAEQTFAAFSNYLTAHIHFENSALYTSIADEALPLQWPLRVYEKEHEKILAMLEKNQQMVNEYMAMRGREKRFALLELLDTQGSFLHVLEHHEEREEKDLFVLMAPLDLAEAVTQWEAINQALQAQHGDFLQQVENYLWQEH